MKQNQDPQSFIVCEECEKAAWQHGFRRQLGHSEGWAGFASTTVPGKIHLAATDARGPWFLALDHAGVIEELGLPEVAMPGPGLTRYAFPTLGEFYCALPHVYQLSASLPEGPLMAFQTKVKGLSKSRCRSSRLKLLPTSSPSARLLL